MLVRLYHDAGIPEGGVRLVQGAALQGQALSTHAGIDGLLFTGSARTGLMLHRAYAETPNRILALEMGGNHPLAVWDPTDIHAAAIVILQSAYLSAGQRCTCARRLIVKGGAPPPLLTPLPTKTRRASGRDRTGQ